MTPIAQEDKYARQRKIVLSALLKGGRFDETK
jgi:hypothetical protein